MPGTVKVLLMAGGRGTRLWPKSRERIPKQFMPLTASPTLFQQTIARIHDRIPTEQMYVVAPPDYVHLIQQQAPELAGQIIVEPVQHGTTASLCFALLWLQMTNANQDDVIVLLPTDAYVSDAKRYQQALADAVAVADAADGTVTIGIPPNYPATGYGYIETDDATFGPGLVVKRFVEKPGADRAAEYFQDDRYYWNSGIFVWKFAVIWNLIQTHLPACARQLDMWRRKWRSMDADTLKTEYLHLPTQSFEYSLVEKAEKQFMIPAAFRWTDLGTWSGLIKNMPHSSERIVKVDSRGCLVEGSKRLVGLYGVQDLIVVETDDVLFICHKNREQELKPLLRAIREQGHERYL